MEEILCRATMMDSPICPLAMCHREMQPMTSRDHAGYDSTTGLRYVHCPACGHIGMVAAGGVQLIYQLAHQYVLTYAPYRSTIIVVLPPRSIALCQTSGLDAEALAKRAAEWTLLSGNSSGTLTLHPEQQEFLDFRGYLRSLGLANSTAPTAA
jgi:hypothetical protein